MARPAHHIPAVAADAVHLGQRQFVRFALAVVALLAAEFAALDVHAVREPRVVRLARVGQPLWLAVGGHIIPDKLGFGLGLAHHGAMALGAFRDGWNP